ncbi:hypothetical protein QJQ45_010875 [Haematococcus lacustris]|nr:hypothetical protein QJQ45_010875 [Haematococcus lacustris]
MSAAGLRPSTTTKWESRPRSSLVQCSHGDCLAQGDQACSSGVANSHQPAATNPVAHAPQATLPSPSSSSNGEAEVVYEDMGSEEVAKFAEAHLGLLAEEVRENGSDFIPMVHLLPGGLLTGLTELSTHLRSGVLPGAIRQFCPASISTEEQEQHVRGAGAFDTPQTLDGFVCFLREKAARLDSLAALSLVPKASVAYPQVQHG